MSEPVAESETKTLKNVTYILGAIGIAFVAGMSGAGVLKIYSEIPNALTDANERIHVLENTVKELQENAIRYETPIRLRHEDKNRTYFLNSGVHFTQTKVPGLDSDSFPHFSSLRNIKKNEWSRTFYLDRPKSDIESSE